MFGFSGVTKYYEYCKNVRYEAFEMFKVIRWSETNGDVVCPFFGSLEKPYFLKTRILFRCKECFYTFSVTSGTIFANHKLPL